MTHRLRSLVLTGLTLLSSCSDPVDSSDPPRVGTGQTDSSESTLAGNSSCEDCASDPQGGESSEYNYDGAEELVSCSEIASATELSLGNAPIAQWVSELEGHYEMPLNWSPNFLGNSVGGYEPDTRIDLDVVIVSAREVEYGSDCGGGRETQLEAEVQLSIADGSLVGQFRQWLRADGGPDASTRTVEWIEGNRIIERSNFEGQLDFNGDAALHETLIVSLHFNAGEVSGSLGARLDLNDPTVNPNARPSYRLWGRFPPLPTPCGRDDSLALDSSVELPGGNANAAVNLIREGLERIGPIQGLWIERGEPSDNSSETPSSLSTHTETLSITVGEATAMCASDPGPWVHAPLQLTSEDGSIAYESSIPWEFRNFLLESERQGLFLAYGRITETPWLPAGQFEERTGIAEVELGESEFAKVSLSLSIDRERDTLNGVLSIDEWRNYEENGGVTQHLALCKGSLCEVQFCLMQTKGAEQASCCPDSPTGCDFSSPELVRLRRP